MIPRLGLGVALCLLALTACSAPSASPSSGAGDGGEITVASSQSWSGFNPHTPDQGKSIELAIGNLIYPSAFVVGDDLAPVLNDDLLVSAEVTSSDPQQVVYTIKPEAVWSDGEPIGADDFTYLWQHLNGSNPDILTTSTVGYDQISAVTGSDDGKTVTVDFSAPFGEWQSLFNAILPAHFMATLGDDVAAWNSGLALPLSPPVGTAFAFASKPDESVIQFTQNPKWWGTPAKIDALTLRYVGDTSAVLQAMANQEVDIASLEATRAIIEQAGAVPGVEKSIVSTPNIEFFAFQFGHPVTQQLAVRQAIATALDNKAIAEAIFGPEATGILTTSHIFAPSSADYVEAENAIAGSDPQGAAKILTAAGFVKGEDGYFEKDGEQLAVMHAAASNSPVDQLVAQLAQDQLKKAGIKLDVKIAPGESYFSDVLIPGDYDSLAFAYPGSAFPAAFTSALYACKGGYNFQRYCNPQVDALYAQAAATLDPTERAALLVQIDELLWADVELVPMFAVPSLSVTSERVAGFTPHPMTAWSLADAAKWSTR